MKHPVHPGRIVKTAIEDLEMSITDTAKMLNIARPTLSNLINQKISLSPEMAVRLSKTIGSTTAFWLKLQHQYDLAQIESRSDSIYVNFTPQQTALG